MNLNDHPTRDQLRELLAGENDWAGHHVLWVTKNGDVRLSTIPSSLPTRNPNLPPEMQLQLETFEVGKDYVGEDAAADQTWIDELFDRLVREWPRAKGKPAAERVDLF